MANSEKLAAIDKRIDQLRARKEKLQAREAEAERKARTKQAIILGAWVLANRPDVVEACKEALTRPQDLAAFGLRPRVEGIEPVGF